VAEEHSGDLLVGDKAACAAGREATVDADQLRLGGVVGAGGEPASISAALAASSA